MRQTLVLLLFVLLLAGCRNAAGDMPTLAPAPAQEAPATGDSDNGASPRVTPKPGLPPTWTPAPTSDLPGPMPTVSGRQPTAEPLTYEVKRGDTLAEIAQEFAVPLAELARVNNIENIDRIEVGLVLIIPR
jgi:LysM repeat protein